MGEGVFPRLSLDLPRYTENDEYYSSLMKEAKENLECETSKQAMSVVSTPRKKKDEGDDTFPAVEVE